MPDGIRGFAGKVATTIAGMVPAGTVATAGRVATGVTAALGEAGRGIAAQVATRGEYASGLKAYLNEQVALGRMAPETAVAIWNDVSTRMAETGEIPVLPYYEQWRTKNLAETAIGEKWTAQIADALERGLKYDIMGRPGMGEPAALELGRLLGQFDAEMQGLVYERTGVIGQDFYQQVYQMKQAAYEQAGISEQMKEYGEVKGRWAGGRREAGERERLAQMFPTPTIGPQYEPAFEEMVGGLAGPQRWKDWFEGKYSKLLGQFRRTLPTPAPVAGEVEKTWAEYLRKRKPELKEEWWSLPSYQRGERPRAFQPPIRQVQF